MNANICQLNTYRIMRGWTSMDQLFWYEWPSYFSWDAHLPLRKVKLFPGPQATPTVLFSLNRGVHICSLIWPWDVPTDRIWSRNTKQLGQKLQQFLEVFQGSRYGFPLKRYEMLCLNAGLLQGFFRRHQAQQLGYYIYNFIGDELPVFDRDCACNPQNLRLQSSVIVYYYIH